MTVNVCGTGESNLKIHNSQDSQFHVFMAITNGVTESQTQLHTRAAHVRLVLAPFRNGMLSSTFFHSRTWSKARLLQAMCMRLPKCVCAASVCMK